MKERGFTLIELAISIFIITLILGTMMGPLHTYVTQRNIGLTQAKLNDINDAVISFAATTGRLPCPASAVSNGIEVCGATTDGYVPSATLGLPGSTVNGLMTDAWNNPIRYAVHTFYTTPGSIQTNWKTTVPLPGLQVCASATGITATTCGPLTNVVAPSAPSVIYSTGANGPTAVSTDEGANINLDPVFVFHTAVDQSATAGEFDDMMIWTSPYLLFSKMFAGGTLP